MIRIDEIYQNVFLPKALDKKEVGLHWFDPFGSTDFADIVNLPPIHGAAKKRIIFWDQEPLHRHTVDDFFRQFSEIYIGPKMLITSEKNSQDLNWACNQFNLDNQYYFFHAWAALDWYRGYDRSLVGVPFSKKKIEKLFLCMNNIIGGQRTHRIQLFKQLIDRGLLTNGFVSFPSVCPYENQSVGDLCKKYQIDLDLSKVSLPMIIDTGGNYHLSSSKIDCWELSNRSLIQVVTETVFYGRKLHLTEKSFKPIVTQQPFILLSCQGSLEYLRSYGFKSFGEFWDESYDDCDDDSRIHRVAELITDLNNLSQRELHHLQRHLISTVEHNFNWFYSKEFENLLWKELSYVLDQF